MIYLTQTNLFGLGLDKSMGCGFMPTPNLNHKRQKLGYGTTVATQPSPELYSSNNIFTNKLTPFLMRKMKKQRERNLYYIYLKEINVKFLQKEKIYLLQ